MSLLDKEPGVTGAIGGGGVLAALTIPITDLLLEVGLSQRASSAITSLIVLSGTVGIALWARQHTVPQSTHDTFVKVALDSPADTTKAELKRAVAREEKKEEAA